MAEKFNNKYRIPSARLSNYDYSWEGLYFITICTKDRQHFFGVIENGEMKLNILGHQVITQWLNTPIIRADMNLELGEFVVMPNHFHAIIYIGRNQYNSVETKCIASEITQRVTSENNVEPQCENVETQYKNVETRCVASLRNGNKFQPQSKNLASIVRGFKSSVTSFARKNDIPFDWQTRYYDRIIRDSSEFEAISNYIINNPKNWKEDDYNTP